jgi:hypothetical protein
MPGKTWSIIVALVLSATTVHAESQPQLTPLDGRQKAAIIVAEAMKNTRLQAVLTQNVHPKASILTLEMLNPASQEEFLNAGVDGSPGLLRADFNGDGYPDYAALLSFPQKKSVGEWLVVLIAYPRGGFQLRLLEKYAGFQDNLYNTMQPPREVKPSKSSRKVKFTMPGIARIHPERPLTLFYWEKGRFQRLKVSEPQTVASNDSSSH